MQIREKTKKAYKERDYPETDLFVEHFKKTYGDALSAVILYGSCLSPSTRSDTSFFDFYLIAENYRDFHKKRLHRKINTFLPPATFYLELTNDQGEKQNCKYCVISLDDLDEQTGSTARDFYHLGRFSKRIAILWAESDFVTDYIVDAALRSWDILAPHAMITASTLVTVDEFAKRLFALSYLGEVRIEDIPSKVSALYEGEKDFYDSVFSELLADYVKKNRDAFKVAEDEPEGYYIQRRTPASRFEKRRELEKLLQQSRRRAKMRWPLQMFTVDGWVDILLAKLERTHGIKIELKPYERKFILFFGWRYYFRLRRQGMIK